MVTEKPNEQASTDGTLGKAAEEEGAPRSRSMKMGYLVSSYWKNLVHRLHWYFPNWTAVDYSDREYERSRDAKENEETRVPEQLELRVPLIWGCELYGPAEIDALYDGLRKLGWKKTFRSNDDYDIARWVEQGRAYGYHGGWLNGGHVVDYSDRRNYSGDVKRAKLPAGVSSLDIQVFQLSPSLTGLLIGFRLSEMMSRRYETEINAVRKTYRRRRPHSRYIEILGPENQKRAATAHVRSGLRRLAMEWFQRHLPGYFASLDHKEAFPVMEMLSVKEGPILSEPLNKPRKTFRSWRRLLSSVFPCHVWSALGLKGIELTMGEWRNEEHGLCITVAVDESQFSDDVMSAYGGKSLESLAFLLNEELRNVLPNATIREYLKEQTRYLNTNREQLKMARAGRANLGRTLASISRFFDQTLGVPALARELEKKAKERGWYRHGMPDFTAPAWKRGSAPRYLADELQSSTHFMASRLAEDEAVMRGHYEQLSSILSIHESVKVQRRMQSLTVLALLVAFLSLLAALAGLNMVKDWLMSYF